MQSVVKEILAVLDSYPRLCSKRMVDSAVRMTKHLNSHLSALSFEVAFKVETPSILHKLGLDSPVLQLIAREREVVLPNECKNQNSDLSTQLSLLGPASRPAE